MKIVINTRIKIYNTSIYLVVVYRIRDKMHISIKVTGNQFHKIVYNVGCPV